MKKIIMMMFILTLAACTPKSKKIEIVFVEGAEFAKDSIVSSCSLIKQVDDFEITTEKSMDFYIDIDGEKMSCGILDTSEIGKHKVMFNFRKQIFEAEYTVVDKEAPKIIADEDIYLEPGEEFDIDKYIQFSDNDYADGIVSGYLDVNSEGIYELTIQCKDQSNNYVEKKVTVHVGDSDKVISITEKNQEEEKKNEIYAERLIAQLEILEKEQKEKIEEEQKTITQEQIEEATKVYDPTCQLGEYEIEAETALDAAISAMELYGCWHVKVELIPEPEPTPSPKPSEETEQTTEPTESPEDNILGTPTAIPEATEEPIPSPEPTPTPEPKIPRFKVKCICTVNSQKYQGKTEEG